MATRTAADRYEQAYNLGYGGKPMTEDLKRASETDHAIFESWRAGRADRDEDGERVEPRTASNTSSPSSASTRPAGKPDTKTGSPRSRRQRTPVARRHSTAGRAYRAGRRVVAPVTTQVGHLILLGLGLVVLYLVLTNAGALSGVVGIIQKTVGWFVSPTI